MIASLPMYDLPDVQEANDRLWRGVRDHLGYGPDALIRGQDPWEHWTSPDLLLSQTCGYPYRARLHGKVTLGGTPDYRIEGCGPGEYCSVFVARQESAGAPVESFAQARFAYNEPLSQSGWAAPANYAEDRGYTFENPHQTGGHLASARAVAEGRADLAAIDALSWKIMTRGAQWAEALSVIAQTPPTPTLPYITACHRDAEPLRMALRAAIDALSAQDRAALSLYGLVEIPADRYLAVPSPRPPGQLETSVP